MAVRDLIPWRKNKVPVKREGRSLTSFQEEMDQLFDEFFRGSDLAPFGKWGTRWSAFNPLVDVVEDEKEVRVSVELPGLDENDIDVSLSHNTLTISGEKRQEREKTGHNYTWAERSYGSFRRSIPLTCQIDRDKVEANFKKGVLTVSLPKVAGAEPCKSITVKSS
jgi:HSP20 family protein